MGAGTEAASQNTSGRGQAALGRHSVLVIPSTHLEMVP